MGNYPSADIIYGFSCGGSQDLIPRNEETYETEYSIFEWEKEYYKRIGKEYPGWRSPSHYTEAHPELLEAGCLMDSHGYSEDAGEFVAIAASHLHGDWDSETIIDPAHFAKTSETISAWNEKLKKFCGIMGIKFQEPKWLMLCSYG